MKNIAILTFQSSNNYGALLQCYALSKRIKGLGNKVSIIDLKKEEIKDLSILSFSSKKKFLLKKYFTNLIFQKEFDVFRNENLKDKYTKSISNLDQLDAFSNKFDGIIVGSDQVWRYAYTKKTLKSYFLEFASNATDKISYAASFGLDYFEGDFKMKSDVKKLIKRFKAVSVREDKGVDICKENFNVVATHVLDPVFLLSSKEYEQLIVEDKEESEKYLAFYLLNPDSFRKELIAKVLKNQGIKQKTNIYTNDKFSFRKPSFPLSKFKFRSFSSWLNTIKNANFIVTDSFHGLAFSIIFNKQFICIANAARGASRMQSILKLLGLESRLVLEGQVDFDIEGLDEIDYSQVNEKLLFQKQKSITFLKNAIES